MVPFYKMLRKNLNLTQISTQVTEECSKRVEIPTTRAGRGYCKSNLGFQVREKSGKDWFTKAIRVYYLYRIVSQTIVDDYFK